MTYADIIRILNNAKIIIEEEWPEEHYKYKVVHELEAAIKEVTKWNKTSANDL